MSEPSPWQRRCDSHRTKAKLAFADSGFMPQAVAADERRFFAWQRQQPTDDRFVFFVG